ncbi:UNVERIFIED_CONTAM: hypothetical protein GTU68_031830, partial [Idotea baltica]|nr:hypothetical protein [Idotea baltica]
PDSVRDPRGFAVKFYTDEGNWDLVGNNTPVFFIRDAIKFPDFIHSQKPDPKTNSQEPTNVWDFFSHSPEATHQFTILFSDRGLPKTVRNMHGYGSHTFQWVNAAGERFWVKFHWRCDQGIENNMPDEAEAIAGADQEHHQHDLYDAIDRGDHPSWTLKAQVMPYVDAETYRVNPFDVTKVWPHADYPLIELGRMTLNRTPENYFAEIEQSAFDPGHLVKGIGPSPDKMLQARLISYGDAARYRLGINHTQLPVNQPQGCPFDHGQNYGRDGTMQFTANGGAAKNYEPNSFGGPVETGEEPNWLIETTDRAGHYDAVIREVDDFEQAGDLFRLLPTEEQDRTVEAIAGGLSKVIDGEIGDGIISRSVEHFRQADADFGSRIAKRVSELR